MSKFVTVSLRLIKSIPILAVNTARENSLILLIVTLYGMAAWTVTLILEQGGMSENTLGLWYLAGFIPPLLALLFLTKVFPQLKAGFRGLKIACRELREHHFTIEAILNLVVILVVIPLFLLSYHTFKIAIPSLHGFSWDETLMKLDFAIHFRHHPWSLLQPLLGYPAITKAIDYCYHHVWGGMLFYMIFWMAWSPRRHLRKQFFFSLLLTWITLGTVLAIVFSSAGPCYFDKISNLENPYTPLMTYLGSISALSVVPTQRMLWEIHAQQIPLFYTGISAMPSIHVATTVLCALTGWHLNRAVGWILTIFAVLIQLGSVHLGWHYALDGYLSALLTVLIWKWTSRVLRSKKLLQHKEKALDGYGETDDVG